MGIRRKARERALQALFYTDMSGYDADDAVRRFCNHFNPPENILLFFKKLTDGVIRNKSDVDHMIKQFSQHWKINRMSCVDRNILRIAVFEMMFCNDIPYKVSINEAIEIGKKYGTEESGAFINGILDSIRLAMEKDESGINATSKSKNTN